MMAIRHRSPLALVRRLSRAVAALLAICAVQLLASPSSDAQSNGAQDPGAPAGVVFSPGFRFTEQNGESLYRNVCSACHMMDGKGASGAGAFPSLVRNEKLQAAGYPLHVVTNGLHGMPPLGAFMSDDAGRRRRQLRADAFRQRLSGRRDGGGCQGRAALRIGADRAADAAEA